MLSGETCLLYIATFTPFYPTPEIVRLASPHFFEVFSFPPFTTRVARPTARGGADIGRDKEISYLHNLDRSRSRTESLFKGFRYLRSYKCHLIL